MVRMSMSPAAAGVLRVLIARAGIEKNRILLTETKSTDWQSLTFTGERHKLVFRISGADARLVAERICCGLDDAELQVAGAIVADIGLVGEIAEVPGEGVELTIEALTVADD